MNKLTAFNQDRERQTGGEERERRGGRGEGCRDREMRRDRGGQQVVVGEKREKREV